jgi:hypothetical protein
VFDGSSLVLVVAGGLALTRATGHFSLPLGYALVALAAAASAFESPARAAMISQLVGADDLSSAITRVLAGQTGFIVGPPWWVPRRDGARASGACRRARRAIVAALPRTLIVST